MLSASVVNTSEGRVNVRSGSYRTFLLSAIVTLCLFAGAPSLRADQGLSHAGPIRSASEIGYPPYCLLDADQQPDGFAVELLRAALKVMGHDVEFKTGPWSEVKQSLVDGRVQVLPLVGRTPEREAVFDFTFPYLTMHGALVVRSDEEAIRSLDDLAGKKLAVMKGDNAEEFVRRKGVDAELRTTATFLDALNGLGAGDYDAVVMQRLLFYQLANENGLDFLKVAGPPLEEFKQSFCFAVREGDSQLLQHLNEGLSIVMANGEFAHLYKKWISPIENARTGKSRIIVGGDANYPPYEYLDENGQPAGYNVELARAIARSMRMDVEIRLRPWHETREALAAGEVDVVQGMFYSPDRDEVFDFTTPHTVISHVAVARRNTPFPKNLAAMTGKRVAVMQDDIMHDLVLEQGSVAELFIADSQEEILNLVREGRCDYALTARIPALFWIEKNGWHDLVVDERSLVASEYCYAATHDNRELLNMFAEGLASVRASGEYRKIYAQTLGKYESGSALLRYVAAVASLLGSVLMLALLWVVMLRRKVRERTVALEVEIAKRQHLLQQVSEREQTTALILNSTAEGICGVDENGVCTFFNRAAEQMLGYAADDVIGRVLHEVITHTDENRRPRRYLAEVLSSGTAIHLEDTILWKKDSDWLNVELLMQPLSKKERIEGAVITFRDISTQKRVIDQRIRSGQLSSLGELAAGVAHEINNPIGGVINYAQILLNRKVGSAQDQKLLANIMKEGERVATIVRNLLNFVHKDRDALAPVDVEKMVQEPMALLSRQLGNDGIIVDVELQEGLPRIYGNTQKLEQVLLNLVSNARHALNEKYPHPDPNKILRIAAEAVGEAENTRVKLVVLDHGCGISADRLKRVFNRFFTTKPAGVGTGLGLSIVHDILEAHGAKITIDSEVEFYTKAVIEFPVYTG